MNVLITGASSGLGFALRRIFVATGDRVVGTSAEKDPPMVTGPMLHWDALSLTHMDRLEQQLRSLGGDPFDLVINNAGINAIREFKDLEEAFIHDILQVNAVAPVMLVHMLLRNRWLAPGASVCNIISDAAWRPMRHSLAYNMSKAALDMATKQMARELTKPHDLTIFGIRPGKMKGTGMSQYIDGQVQKLRGWTAEEANAYFRNNSVSGMEAMPSDVAALIHSICTSGVPISGACLDLAG